MTRGLRQPSARGSALRVLPDDAARAVPALAEQTASDGRRALVAVADLPQTTAALGR